MVAHVYYIVIIIAQTGNQTIIQSFAPDKNPNTAKTEPASLCFTSVQDEVHEDLYFDV